MGLAVSRLNSLDERGDIMHLQSNQTDNNPQIANRVVLTPSKKPWIFNVELHLPFKTVYPGKLDLSGEGLLRMKRKPEYIHRKMNAWGVCAEVIEQHEFKWICITCAGREYVTSKAFLTRFGKRLTHRNYEAQYFLELPLWGIEAVREFEKCEARKPQQLSFFQVGAA
jgi:hypothetical protein